MESPACLKHFLECLTEYFLNNKVGYSEFEIWTIMNFRHSKLFSLLTDFRHCLMKSESKVQFIDTFFIMCLKSKLLQNVWNVSEIQTFAKCLKSKPKFGFQTHRSVWNLNSQKFGFQINSDFKGEIHQL